MVEQRILNVGELRIDALEQRVWVGQNEVRLPSCEFSLLVYLARQANKAVAVQKLAQVVYDLDIDYIKAKTLLQPLVFSLCSRIVYLTEHDCLENVWGVGYRLVSPEA